MDILGGIGVGLLIVFIYGYYRERKEENPKDEEVKELEDIFGFGEEKNDDVF